MWGFPARKRAAGKGGFTAREVRRAGRSLRRQPRSLTWLLRHKVTTTLLLVALAPLCLKLGGDMLEQHIGLQRPASQQPASAQPSPGVTFVFNFGTGQARQGT